MVMGKAQQTSSGCRNVRGGGQETEVERGREVGSTCRVKSASEQQKSPQQNRRGFGELKEECGKRYTEVTKRGNAHVKRKQKEMQNATKRWHDKKRK